MRRITITKSWIVLAITFNVVTSFRTYSDLESTLFTGADYDKENDWKFKYVSEVPESSRKKKVFYIYGKGM